ncbi:MAG: hypothetical protein ACM3ZT_02830 [Bacillota bacterium]
MVKGIAASFGLALVLTMTGVGHAQESDTVWVWNSKCQNAIVITLRVQLDGKTVFQEPISICRWKRDFENGKTSFKLTAHRPIVWYGYRSDPGDGTKDPGDKVPADTPMEIDLWQAGGEPDLIELGYSAAAGDGLHTNSVHLLMPTKPSKTIMARGLVLETWPVKKQ